MTVARIDRIHPTADLIMAGGTVLTFDDADRTGTALAVRAGQIVAVGTDAEVAQHAGAATRHIDLSGRTVIPGINDSHLHGTWLGALWPHTLIGSGGFAPPTAAPARIDDEAGRRTAIMRAGKVCAQLGITSYTEAGLGPGEDHGDTGCFSQAVLNTYAALAADGDLLARVTVLRLFGLLDGPSRIEDFEEGLDTEVPASDPRWLNVTGVKIFADGIPPMRSAWTRHRYDDDTTGRLLVEGADDNEREHRFRRMVALAHARGLQIGVHATGDRSMEVFADAVADCQDRYGPGARHYAVHADLVTSAQVARMAELGIGITTQPGIAVATAPMVAAVLGDDVAATAWPLSEILGSGLPVTLSSDGPVLPPDWRVQIAAAATLLGAADTDPNPDLMTRLLRCYTTVPAFQDGAEAWKGSLEPGKVADLCVLETDPRTVPPSELPGVGIEMTVIDGRVVFTAPHVRT
ncbi:amidohydrolase [Phytoactinopolyspora limicola]|uniref:amidohydrolase n=1 Tax=Phytoactinopolyspora limicola TaxID=2715536 RepID=UPI001A9C6B8C|nr:amidohydrolase family protein [Phytoactinopolyspora limicola]